MNGFKLLLLSVSFLFATNWLVACDTTANTPPPQPVVLQLNWTPEAQFAGFYAAQQQGYYADEGLAVTIKPGGFPLKIDPVKALENKKTDFAILGQKYFQNLVAGEGNGVAVMAGAQISPVALFSPAEKNIRQPHDLVGRRIAIKDKKSQQTLYQMLQNVGIDPADVIEVPLEADADLQQLYEDKVDVWIGHACDEPVEAQVSGHAVNLIFPAEYGLASYDSFLSVHRDTLAAQPDMIDRFVRATRKGWEYALSHPDETVEVLVQVDPSRDANFHRLALQAYLPLIDTGMVPIGWIDETRWKMAQGDQYDPENPGYDMSFIPALSE